MRATRIKIGKVDRYGFCGRDYHPDYRVHEGAWGTVVRMIAAGDPGERTATMAYYLVMDFTGEVLEVLDHEIDEMIVVKLTTDEAETDFSQQLFPFSDMEEGDVHLDPKSF